jgi:homoserine O-acetyltransferase
MSTTPLDPAVDRVFELGDVTLACGKTIPQGRIVYRQFGTINADGSNLILMPTSYGARPADLAWTVGPVLDPERWCIVIAGQFGNGLSSSPSHGAMGLAEQGWVVHHSDNVAAQKRLIEEQFGVNQLALIYGWSMGAQQAYQWAVTHPTAVERLCCICGTARTSVHNKLFCLSLRQALTADPSWNGTGFDGDPEQGLRTFALIYASWAVSQPHYRGITEPLEQHVEQQWLPHYRRHDPRDLLAMIDTWMVHDVAPGADLGQTLERITARSAVVAGSHDLYFTVDDMAAEAEHIADAEFYVIASELGHRAGNPHSSPAEQQVLRRIVDQLLDS